MTSTTGSRAVSRACMVAAVCMAAAAAGHMIMAGPEKVAAATMAVRVTSMAWSMPSRSWV